MGSKLSQFSLLIWKNFVLQKRRKLATCIEISIPILFALLLIAIRVLVDSNPVTEPTIYNAFNITHLPFSLTWQHSGLPTLWNITFTPDTIETNKLMDMMAKHLQKHDGIYNYVSARKGQGFSTEADMLDYVALQNSSSSFVLGAITFHNINSSPTNFTYSIRLSPSLRNAQTSTNSFKSEQSSWFTDMLFSPLDITFPRNVNDTNGGPPDYFREGFLAIQHAMDRAILKYLDAPVENFSVDMRRYPYPPFQNDLFLIAIQTQLPIIILFSLIYGVLNITRSIVHEKERRLKESMKMMGLRNWLHWTAWFIKYFIMLYISVIIMTTLFAIPIQNKGAILKSSNPTVIFVFLMLYAITSIALAFLISTLFSKANTATAVGGLVWLLSYIPYSFIYPRYSTMTRTGKMTTCLISNTCMAIGTYVISMFEGRGDGVQWSNVGSPVSSDDNFSMSDVFVMFVVDTLLYLFLTWYIEAVFPGEYGIPRPWYFFVTKSYWCGYTVVDDVTELVDDERQPLLSANGSASLARSASLIESDPVGIPAGIQIKNLKKVYKGNKVAVNSISLNMYEGQITALLGHNGAGKTSTISMLTGLFPPTKGTAIVNGHDIRSDIEGVHCQLGLCPQHDVLFENLTVEEHLYFFAKLKGLPKEKVQAEIDNYIVSLKLEDKRHVLAKALSGGMKRKLSVGIALIADSKIVMLDEPTSGMDPSARRFTWDLLQQHRKGRTILLTTHYMDEADLLGDRIAIMAEGDLQCVGSSLFLKKKYGVGYHMSIAKGDNCNVDAITTLVTSHVQSASLENNVGAELSFILPKEEVSEFEKLFLEMEAKKDELAINSYGASVTTMEEVFLKVGSKSAIEESDGSMSMYSINTTSSQEVETTDRLINDSDFSEGDLYEENPVRNSGFTLYWQQFWALFIKRILHFKRNWILLIVQLYFPISSTLFSLVAEKTYPTISDSPPLITNVSVYGDVVVPYQVVNQSIKSLDDLAAKYSDQFSQSKAEPEQVMSNISMVDYLINEAIKSSMTFSMKNIISATFNYSDVINATAYFNNQPYHSAPATLNAIDNALLKYYTNDSFSITTINHPLPRSFEEKASDQVNHGAEAGYAVAFNLLFGMSFFAASFVVFLIKERTIKSKHLQFVSGVRISNFWLASYAWDLLSYALVCVICCMIFLAFDVDAYVDDGHLIQIYLVLFLHGWAVIPLMYLLSFLFKVPSTGFVAIAMFNVIFGTTAFVAVNILLLPYLNLVNVGKALDWIFLLSPSYMLGMALGNFYNNFQILQVCSVSPAIMEYCKSNPEIYIQEDYFAWEYPGIGKYVTFLSILGFFYSAVIVLLEMGVLRRIGYILRGMKVSVTSPETEESVNSQEDEDVQKERQRVETSDLGDLHTTDCLVMRNLQKIYPETKRKAPVIAVENTSLGVPARECFGLLGVNGAGKTTTFKMLTGDEAVSGGDAFVDGLSVKTNTRQAQQRIGYCPQFDGLIDQMTGRETLFMYARLRGVPEKRIASKVNCLLNIFNLMEHADKQTKAYSGGNKRKLSTAVALIGDSPLVLLDEPSTGMDPVTRRLLWSALCKMRDAGRSIILTSHSMEECEALCTRLAIMVNGAIKCLGSTQHLKSRFGEGYTLLAKVPPSKSGFPPDLEPLKEFIINSFPGSKLKDEHQGHVHYHITDSSIPWATVFGTLERAKAQYNIEDYSVSQTTLEQVFLNFARMQREEDD